MPASTRCRRPRGSALRLRPAAVPRFGPQTGILSTNIYYIVLITTIRNGPQHPLTRDFRPGTLDTGKTALRLSRITVMRQFCMPIMPQSQLIAMPQ